MDITVFPKDYVAEVSGNREILKMSDAVYTDFVDAVEIRVLASMCLDAFPESLPADLKIYLANVIGFLDAYRSNVNSVNIASQSIEHVSVNYGSDGQIDPVKFARLWASTFEKYSACEGKSGVMFQTNLSWWQYAPDGFGVEDISPDFPIGLGKA